VEQRLKFVFQRVRMLAEKEDPTEIQSSLTGLNPELGDRVPLRLMRENDLETVAPEIMGAARAFLVRVFPEFLFASALNIRTAAIGRSGARQRNWLLSGLRRLPENLLDRRRFLALYY
jgi:hypothetical protein